MSTIHDGGPAFPVIVPDQRFPDGQPIQQGFVEPGLSMRDWFAGQALTSLIISTAKNINYDAEDAAREAYQHADAMIAHRAKKESP